MNIPTFKGTIKTNFNKLNKIIKDNNLQEKVEQKLPPNFELVVREKDTLLFVDGKGYNPFKDAWKKTLNKKEHEELPQYVNRVVNWIIANQDEIKQQMNKKEDLFSLLKKL